jgi:hypothetical protein
VLAELRRVCSPDAIVVVFTNCRGLRLRPWLLRLSGKTGRGVLDWKDLQDGHRNRFSDRELTALVEQAGFRVRRKLFFSHLFEPLVTHALDLVRSAVRRAQPPASDGRGVPLPRRTPLERLLLGALTGVMALDLLVFGRLPGGGVFLELEPAG